MGDVTAPAPPLGSVVKILDCLQPRPRLSVSEWSDAYRVIPAGTSPEHGQWHTDRTPYLRGILDSVNEPGVDTVALMMASQMGKTEFLLCLLGYYVDQDPAPILLVQPTIEAVESFSKERIEPGFRASPTLRNKLESGKDDRGSSRKSSQTIRLKMFPGGYIAMAGSNAPAGLASRPIRIVLCDEIDRFAESSGTEGDPIALAFQRTSNFEHNRKRILVSTPTIDGMSKIQDWHAQGDQRQFHVPCPHCGSLQVLQWERLTYKDAEGKRDLEHVHYLCEHCRGRIEEHHKPGMLAAGEWIAQVPGGANGSGKVVSFGDLSALYSPWVKWRTLVEEWTKAHDNRDRKGLQEFVNLRLGQPFVEHQQTIAVEYLERRREYYDAEVPEGVLLLTAGVDVQDDRLEMEVVGWGVGKESWGIQYFIAMGSPGDAAVWQLLDTYLAQTWQATDGRRMGISCTCVDSGGHYTSEVYQFCRAREARYIWAIKGGKDGPGQPAVGKPTRNNRFNAALFTLGVHDLKGILMSRLMIDSPGPGHCHFPREPERGYGPKFFDGLLSEKHIVVQRGGVKKHTWKKIHDRNEPLDCRVYGTAALEMLNVNLEQLAERIRAASMGVQPAAARSGAQRGRRVLSRGVS